MRRLTLSLAVALFVGATTAQVGSVAADPTGISQQFMAGQGNIVGGQMEIANQFAQPFLGTTTTADAAETSTEQNTTEPAATTTTQGSGFAWGIDNQMKIAQGFTNQWASGAQGFMGPVGGASNGSFLGQLPIFSLYANPADPLIQYESEQDLAEDQLRLEENALRQTQKLAEQALKKKYDADLAAIKANTTLNQTEIDAQSATLKTNYDTTIADLKKNLTAKKEELRFNNTEKQNELHWLQQEALLNRSLEVSQPYLSSLSNETQQLIKAEQDAQRVSIRRSRYSQKVNDTIKRLEGLKINDTAQLLPVLRQSAADLGCNQTCVDTCAANKTNFTAQYDCLNTCYCLVDAPAPNVTAAVANATANVTANATSNATVNGTTNDTVNGTASVGNATVGNVTSGNETVVVVNGTTNGTEVNASVVVLPVSDNTTVTPVADNTTVVSSNETLVNTTIVTDANVSAPAVVVADNTTTVSTAENVTVAPAVEALVAPVADNTSAADANATAAAKGNANKPVVEVAQAAVDAVASTPAADTVAANVDMVANATTTLFLSENQYQATSFSFLNTGFVLLVLALLAIGSFLLNKKETIGMNKFDIENDNLHSYMLLKA